MTKDKSSPKQVNEPELASYHVLDGMDLVMKKNEQISGLCARFRVQSLDLFGSAVNGSFHQDSDYDFLVRFKDIPLEDYFENYIGFQEALEKLLGRNIDLLEVQTLKNPFLIESIEKEKVNIYEV